MIGLILKFAEYLKVYKGSLIGAEAWLGEHSNQQSIQADCLKLQRACDSVLFQVMSQTLTVICNRLRGKI